MFDCNRCERKFDNYESLRRHVGRIHKINSHDFFVEFKLNGIYPTCKCGCNQKTKWNVRTYDFCNFIAGHQSRIYNNWGHNKNAIEHSAETRRKQYASGERKVWNDGLTKETNIIVAELGRKSTKELNPERARKISKSLSGMPKSDLHNAKNTKHWREYWSKDENRKAQRIRRVEYMKKFLQADESKLEKVFKKLLESVNIKYKFQYDIDGYNFDFFIENTNILIETDGDFWHCNPIFWPNPIYESQKHTINHDKIKNEVSLKNNYKLLRFWESDIKNEPAKVMKILLENIYAIK